MGCFGKGSGVADSAGLPSPSPSRVREGSSLGCPAAACASPPAGGRGSRGGLLRERTFDGLDNTFQVAQNVVVPEADDAPALGFEIAGSGVVISGALVVLAAINLDDQPFGARSEVCDVGSDRDLAVKAYPRDLTTGQRSPQPSLRTGRIEAQFSRLLRRSVFSERAGALPSVPSRLREGMRLWRRAVLATKRNRPPSRRREGLGEGTPLAIETPHQPHSRPHLTPAKPSPTRSPCSYPAPPHAEP